MSLNLFYLRKIDENHFEAVKGFFSRGIWCDSKCIYQPQNHATDSNSGFVMKDLSTHLKNDSFLAILFIVNINVLFGFLDCFYEKKRIFITFCLKNLIDLLD